MPDLSDMLVLYARNRLGFDPDNNPDIVISLKDRLSGVKGPEVLPESPVPLVRRLLACSNETDDMERARFADNILASLSPSQDSVDRILWTRHARSPEDATGFLFELGQANHYIQSEKIALNRHYHMDDVIVTINLSKEEKDLKRVLGDMKPSTVTFPKCPLCHENIGYPGTGNHPPRGTLRVAHMTLSGDPWFMQFSPYPYFDEHAIFIDRIHRPMTVDLKSIRQLTEIIRLFPHYFVGTNAGMPITGGSILSHAHFQGGKDPGFPLFKARDMSTFDLPGFEDVKASTVDWSAFVIRLVSRDDDTIARASMRILDTFRTFDAPDAGLESFTGDTPHHGMAAIASRQDDMTVMHIVLRSNRTDNDHPHGLFHVRASHHHIKKEGVGLIEALGMFILPGRLAPVLDRFASMRSEEDFLSLKQNHPIHASWLDTLERSRTFDKSELNATFIKGLADVCRDILHDISVFRDTKEGREAKVRFMSVLQGDTSCSN
jgi:UDPglucose--hexose-1-phosphate uridylyltransferase